MTDKKLLTLRNERNKKKPEFLRQDISRRPALKRKWVKPMGIHSKLKTKNRGKGKLPRVGYSAPRLVKGLDKNGFNIITISNMSEISKIRPNIDTVKINSKVGNKKRLLLLENLKKASVNVMNFKSIDKKIELIKGVLEKRKKQKAKKVEITKETKKEEPKKEKKKKEIKE